MAESLETAVNTSAAAALEAPRRVRPGRASTPQPPSWVEALGPGGILKIVVLAALLSWMYWDHFVRLFKYWQEPDWSHGFLIPLFCLYLVHLRRDKLLSGTHSGSLWGLALMILSSAVYAFSLYAKIGYPQALSIVSMIAGIVLLMRGWRTLWLTLFPIAFLILALPPPERMYRQITQPLQQGAAALSTIVLNCLPGADVERMGINISYWVRGHPSGTFTVAGACSGMRSLMAFVSIGLILAYITPRPLWQRLATAIVVVPVALFCNVVRVVVTGIFQMYGYGDLASGTPHMVLGLMTFALGFAIFLGFLWVLDHLYLDNTEKPVAGVGT